MPTGLFPQTLSMLPTRILRLLEFVGFSGNKVTTFLLGLPAPSEGLRAGTQLDRVQLDTALSVPPSQSSPGSVSVVGWPWARPKPLASVFSPAEGANSPCLAPPR